MIKKIYIKMIVLLLFCSVQLFAQKEKKVTFIGGARSLKGELLFIVFSF
jgi:hypothetical protein